MSTAGDPEHYSVHASGVILARYRQLQRLASHQGRGRECLRAIREIHRHLQRHPFAFGEALYTLPALRMQVRAGVIAPLIVHFAVCEDRPLVFVKGFELMAAKES